ncbi:hypothetical protein SAMN05421553_0904 [Pseudomonas anguilliseptica]|uniref:Uncharacterized protein n=1 Tax=Pseudomonas anguilliseptica TaxID=53406 RepID=A0A1H4SRN5_PSEAG|nr:hypothetical protein SAMN05421553_0904 [Pseudomonas anguilliseptica]
MQPLGCIRLKTNASQANLYEQENPGQRASANRSHNVPTAPSI